MVKADVRNQSGVEELFEKTGERTHQVLGNMLAWFLGLVTYFAAEIDFSFASYTQLGIATTLGGFAGYVCQELNRRLAVLFPARAIK